MPRLVDVDVGSFCFPLPILSIVGYLLMMEKTIAAVFEVQTKMGENAESKLRPHYLGWVNS